MSPPNALLALADVASVYEECASYAASLSAHSAFVSAPTSSTASQSSMTDVPRRSTTPISSRPAKKRPVPLELAMAAFEVAEEPSKKVRTAPDDVSTALPRLPPSQPKATSHGTKSKSSNPKDKPDKKKTKTKKSRRNSNTTPPPSFPAILMGIISTPQNSMCITFLSDDQRFVILDGVKFESEVLPMHFEATPESPLYASFLRMLDEWGFKIESAEEFPGIVVYSHPMFKKGDWEGCLNICKPGSVVEVKQIAQVADAPAKKSAKGPKAKCPKAKSSETVAQPPQVPPAMEPPTAQNLGLLNATLSQHMTATESSRILCNRFGLLQDSLALQAVMQAQQARSRMISAAVGGLDGSSPRTISPEFQTAVAAAGAQNPNLPLELDVMTARFIKSSMERMQSRQVMRSHFNGFGMPNNA